MPSSFEERCMELAEALRDLARPKRLGNGKAFALTHEEIRSCSQAARLIEALPGALAIRSEGPGDDLSDHYDGMRAALNGVRDALTAAATPPSAAKET